MYSTERMYVALLYRIIINMYAISEIKVRMGMRAAI